MASFQAKIGWKRRRKRENKNYRFVPFRSYLTRYRIFQKNSKEIQKIKNTIMASFQAKIGWKRMRKRENKNYSFVRSPTWRRIENSEKIKKIKQYHYGSISSQKVERGLEGEKIKIIVSFRSFLTRYGKFQKNSNKIQKIKKKYRYGIISSQNRLKEDEKERK